MSKRILVCGLCPLPFENTRKSFGPGIRSWQLASGPALAGHRVHLVAMQIPGAYGEAEPLREETRANITIERLSDAEFFDPATVASRIERLRPDAVVGATVYGSYVLARAHPPMPFWADQFGHFMAEAQAKARLENQNWPVAHFWRHLEPVLRAADKVSTVSRRQRLAAIGELGLVGRLTAETCGYEFTAVVPCALIPPAAVEIRPKLRPTPVPQDAFVVFWSGGYNVWSDVETLFRGLEIAMAQEPKIHFVSTGGEIDGHDVRTYRSFRDLIAASRFGDRYHLQGWVDSEEVPSYQAEADLGVLTDKPMYEGRLGHKNRIVQWLGAGLPVVYNDIGDLGELLRTADLGLVFDAGDDEGLARQILRAAGDREALRRRAARARKYTEEHLSIEATTRDLVAWVESPVHAPDVEVRRTVFSLADFERQTPRTPEALAEAAAAAERRAAAVEHRAGELESRLERIEEALAASRRRTAAADRRAAQAETRGRELDTEIRKIHSSKMWRLWMTYIRIRRWVMIPFRRRKAAAP